MFGSIEHISYRFAIAKPFIVTSTSALTLSPEGYTNFSGQDPQLQTSGYVVIISLKMKIQIVLLIKAPI